MAKKSAKRSAPKKPSKPKARRAPAATKEKDAFEDSLLAHGQAARRRADGTLPPGATHEITVGENGETKIVRRRFSIL